MSANAPLYSLHVADNLNRLALGLGAALLETAVENGHNLPSAVHPRPTYQCERWSIKIVNKGCFQQRRQRGVRLGGRVSERLQKSALNLLDLRIAQNLAKLLQTRRRRSFDLSMRIIDNASELGNDSRERHRKLLGCTEGHGTAVSSQLRQQPTLEVRLIPSSFATAFPRDRTTASAKST